MEQTKITAFEKEIGYTFSDKQHLVLALTHSSYANEHGMDKTMCNERLEFLGDAIVDLAASDWLFRNLPDSQEGVLTKLRASVVCEGSFAQLAREMHFGDYILLGKGEEATGGRTRASVLADCFEAVIAAIYLDSDLKTVLPGRRRICKKPCSRPKAGKPRRITKPFCRKKRRRAKMVA